MRPAQEAGGPRREPGRSTRPRQGRPSRDEAAHDGSGCRLERRPLGGGCRGRGAAEAGGEPPPVARLPQSCGARAHRAGGQQERRLHSIEATNYIECALITKVNMQAQGVWEAIEGHTSFFQDRTALAAILRAMPPEMHATLAGKETTKEARDAIKSMRIGDVRVHETKAQGLLSTSVGPPN